jgi:hypothetical protein
MVLPDGSGHGGVDVGVDEIFEFCLGGAFHIMAAAWTLDFPEVVEGFVECAAGGGFVAGERREALFRFLEGIGESRLADRGLL